MYIDDIKELKGIEIPDDQDGRDVFLAAYGVHLARKRAIEHGWPLYYVKDGYLVEERDGHFKKLQKVTKNEIFGCPCKP